LCGRGGTGRRAALRSLWGNSWRFESSRPHQLTFRWLSPKPEKPKPANDVSCRCHSRGKRHYALAAARMWVSEGPQRGVTHPAYCCRSERHRSRPRPYELIDGGARWWRYEFRFGGKKIHGLGCIPGSQPQRGSRRSRCGAVIAEGRSKDPAAERKAEKRASV
jgi:hypothetical protein